MRPRTNWLASASLAVMAAAMLPTNAKAQNADATAPSSRPIILDTLLVSASKAEARTVGGSVTFIGPEELEKFSYSDVNRVLRQAPGVYIQEEEGFGLRPNIGIRGSGSDRSSKISIMEDGVLVAPAPYSAPAAYYFPHTGRLSAFEVTKGASSIKYGPSTIGGAINMLSTQVPETGNAIGGKLDVIGGEFGTLRVHGVAGGFIETGGPVDVGLMVETLNDRSEGFKNLDGGNGRDTGFRIQDYVGKLVLRTSDDVKTSQSLEFKVQYSDEDSDETYLGLTLDDFNQTPFRRYRGSQVDNMKVNHTTLQATHRIDLTEMFDLTTTAYYTKTKRAWFKLNDVVDPVNGRVSISNLLANPGANPGAMAAIIGAPGFVSANNALRVRNNNREYYTKGVQSVLGTEFDLGPTSHRLEVSARYHEDEEDRFQEQDEFRMDNGTMVLTNKGAPGSQANRVGEAKAWAFYAQDTVNWGPLTIKPGVRFETIKLTRTDFAGTDPNRLAPTSVRKNTIDVWVPGISATYDLTPELQVLGGVHKGFSSPAPGSTAEAETSVNYEAGGRFSRGAFYADVIGFYNDYANLVGTCTISTGGSCTVGQQFDGGEARVRGVEVSAGYNAGTALGMDIGIPLSIAYTHTDSEFQSSFVSQFGPWGNVSEGDEFPFVPQNTVTLNAGLEGETWRVSSTLNYVSEARNTAGSGPIAANDLIDARTLIDISGEIDIADGVSLFGAVENLTDKVYNVAFRPAGARPGKPRTALGGIKVTF